MGQNAWEEIDHQPASSAGGENWGWRRMEGFHCYNPSSSCNDGTLVLPIFEYDHGLGCSVTGGFRYRGSAIPGSYGVYFYADYCTGRVWRGIEDGDGAWTSSQLADTAYNISSFGEDEAGRSTSSTSPGRSTSSPRPRTRRRRLQACPLPSVIAGDPGFTLTVNGSGFVYGSVVRWNGSDRPTTFVSAAQLKAEIPASDFPAAGTATVTVFSPAPGGGLSGPANGQHQPDVPRRPGLELRILLHPGRLQRRRDGRLRAAALLPGRLDDAGPDGGLPAPGERGPRLRPAAGDRDGLPRRSRRPRFAADWIEDLAGRGITGGCGNGNYCPDSAVTRAQMAPFLLKTDLGSGYVPPACAGTVFLDVPCPGGIFDPWIEDLAGRGITGGCGNGNYCPDNPNTRAQMAVFLTLTFNLPIP